MWAWEGAIMGVRARIWGKKLFYLLTQRIIVLILGFHLPEEPCVELCLTTVARRLMAREHRYHVYVLCLYNRRKGTYIQGFPYKWRPLSLKYEKSILSIILPFFSSTELIRNIFQFWERGVSVGKPCIWVISSRHNRLIIVLSGVWCTRVKCPIILARSAVIRS